MRSGRGKAAMKRKEVPGSNEDELQDAEVIVDSDNKFIELEEGEDENAEFQEEADQ